MNLRKRPTREYSHKDVLRLGVIVAAIIVIFAVELNLSLTYSIFSFAAVSCAMIVIENSRHNLLNPAVGFTLFYLPYVLWYPIYCLLAGTGNQEVLISSIVYAQIGLLAYYVAYLLVIGRAESRRPEAAKGRRGRSFIGEILLARVCFVIMILGWTEALTSGYAGKTDLRASAGIFLTLSVYAVWILTATYIVYLIRSTLESSTSGKVLLAYMATFLLDMAITGERDSIFRSVICTLFVIYHRRRNAGPATLVFIFLAAAFILPISQDLKLFLLAESISLREFSLEHIFISEYSAPARNVYMLLQHGYEQSWSFFFSDLTRALLPVATGDLNQSAGAWYNNVYRERHGFHGTSGWGFSLVAEGILIGGALGVIVLFLIMGVVLTKFYQLRELSEYRLAFYVLSLSTAIYCIRADFANLLSQTIKLGGGAVIVVYLAGELARRGWQVKYKVAANRLNSHRR